MDLHKVFKWPSKFCSQIIINYCYFSQNDSEQGEKVDIQDNKDESIKVFFTINEREKRNLKPTVLCNNKKRWWSQRMIRWYHSERYQKNRKNFVKFNKEVLKEKGIKVYIKDSEHMTDDVNAILHSAKSTGCVTLENRITMILLDHN